MDVRVRITCIGGGSNFLEDGIACLAMTAKMAVMRPSARVCRQSKFAKKWLKDNWQMELFHIQDENRQRIATLNDVLFGYCDSDGRFVLPDAMELFIALH